MERAIELEPQEAEITSHLGDAYWQANRHSEALYKWRYAAQITNDSALQADLQAKLVSGLPVAGQ